MKKSIRIFLVALLVVLIGGLAVLVFTVRGPGELDPKLIAIIESNATWKDRQEPLRQLGTNIIPSLRIMIRRHDSPLKLKLLPLAYRLHLAKRPTRTPDEWHWYAHEICPLVDIAVRTQLVEDWIYLVERGSTQDRFDAWAAQAGGVGPEALPALLKALQSRNPRVREFAASTIRFRGQNEVIVPALLPKLQDPDEVVRAVSLLALASLRPEPETIVPAFITALSDPSALVRADACNALRGFAPFAKAAVPALVKALQDPDSNVRKLAADALQLIDNEAAQKAGVK